MNTVQTQWGELLKQVFCDVFCLSPDQITDDLSPRSVPTWDSMQHLNLVVSIEERFGISLDPDDIERLRTGFAVAKDILAEKLDRCR